MGEEVKREIGGEWERRRKRDKPRVVTRKQV
jgi:hypothetical protein